MDKEKIVIKARPKNRTQSFAFQVVFSKRDFWDYRKMGLDRKEVEAEIAKIK